MLIGYYFQHPLDLASEVDHPLKVHLLLLDIPAHCLQQSGQLWVVCEQLGVLCAESIL